MENNLDGALNIRTKFSIIVPIYNSEKYLSDCINSLLNQNYTDYEIILVDDGSTDNSGKIIDSFESDKVKVIHKENGGQISARVEGFKASSGEYILFVDSDDEISDNMLYTLNGYISKFRPDCIIFGLETFNNDGVLSTTKAQFSKATIINEKSDLMEIVLNDYGYNSVCRKAIRREFIDNIDLTAFHNIRFAEDLLESLEIYENAKNFLFIPEILYKYRINENSVTHSANIKSSKFDFIVREETFKYIERLDCFNKKQLKDYRGYCIKLLVETLMQIADFDSPKKEKIKIFKKIKNTDYYQNRIYRQKYNIRKVGKKVVVFWMFKMNMYNFIVLFSKILSSIRRKF